MFWEYKIRNGVHPASWRQLGSYFIVRSRESTNQSINQSIKCMPKGRSFTANSAFSNVPSSQSTFSYLHTVYLRWCLSFDIFFCREPSSRLPFLLEHPSAGSSFLASGPVNFFSSPLSVLALFFLLPVLLVQLHFYFVCPLYTLHPSPYPHLKCFQSLLLIPP